MVSFIYCLSSHMISRLSKQWWWSKKFAIASLSTLFSAALTSPAFARTYEFVFGNYTGEDLVAVYWRSATTEDEQATAESWGNNFFAEGSVLPVDGVIKFEIVDQAPDLETIDPYNEDIVYPEDCLFDIRGVLSSGKVLEEYGINLCEISQVTGFFDFIDTATFYQEGGQEFFITNKSNFSLVELAFENSSADQFFVFGSSLRDELSKLGESPSLPGGETELFLIDIPDLSESGCNTYRVTSTFKNEATGATSDYVTESVDICSDHDEIMVSNRGISMQSFDRRPITVENNTPHRLVTLEIAPSFRPELWLNVTQDSFIPPNTKTEEEDIAAAIQLTSNDESATCLYDIYGVLITDAQTAQQVSVTQYLVDLCTNENTLTFRPGIVLD